MTVKRVLYLYSTAYCHLCDEAKALCEATLNRDYFDVQTIDIALDEQLVERYGVRIPVLLDSETGQELGWPFDQPALVEFLSSVLPDV